MRLVLPGSDNSGCCWLQEMIEWYTAIRAAKLNRLAIAYPSAQVDEVCPAHCCIFMPLLIGCSQSRTVIRRLLHIHAIADWLPWKSHCNYTPAAYSCHCWLAAVKVTLYLDTCCIFMPLLIGCSKSYTVICRPLERTWPMLFLHSTFVALGPPTNRKAANLDLMGAGNAWRAALLAMLSANNCHDPQSNFA